MKLTHLTLICTAALFATPLLAQQPTDQPAQEQQVYEFRIETLESGDSLPTVRQFESIRLRVPSSEAFDHNLEWLPEAMEMNGNVPHMMMFETDEEMEMRDLGDDASPERLRQRIERLKDKLEKQRATILENSAIDVEERERIARSLAMAQLSLDTAMLKLDTLHFSGAGMHTVHVFSNGNLNGNVFYHTDSSVPSASSRAFTITDWNSYLASVPAMPVMPSCAKSFFTDTVHGMMIIDGDSIVMGDDRLDAIRVYGHGGNGSVISIDRSQGGNAQVITNVAIAQGGGSGMSVLTINGDTTIADARSHVVIIKRGEGKEIVRRRETVREKRNEPNGASSIDRTASNAGYALAEPVPNPLGDETKIGFTLAKPGHTTLTLFDNAGKVVKTLLEGDLTAGSHTVTVDAAELPSGFYLYRLVSGDYAETKTMTVNR